MHFQKTWNLVCSDLFQLYLKTIFVMSHKCDNNSDPKCCSKIEDFRWNFNEDGEDLNLPKYPNKNDKFL